MRPIHVSVIVGLSIATLGVSQAELEGEIYGGISTEYIFRGVDQGGGSLVEAGINFSGFSFAGFDFHSSLWYGSIGRGDFGGSFDEIDYQSGVRRDFGFMTLGVGQITYNFPGTARPDPMGGTLATSAQEIYFTLMRTQWDFDFAVSYFWDIDEDNDGYSELTVDRTFALSECLGLEAGATISYEWESGDIRHYGLSTALNWAYNDVLTVSPYASLTFAGDGAQSYSAGGDPRQGDEFFGGIIVKAAF